MKNGRMQAKDIPDRLFAEAILYDMACREIEWGHRPLGATRWRVADYIGAPDRVVLAKARSFFRRGLIDGCFCGCRGDWEPTALHQ